jgi:hypothetical protein
LFFSLPLSLYPPSSFSKEGNGSEKNGKRGSEMEFKKNDLMNFRSPNFFSQNKYERKCGSIIFRVLSPFISKEREHEKIEDKAKRIKKRKRYFDFRSSLPS